MTTYKRLIETECTCCATAACRYMNSWWTDTVKRDIGMALYVMQHQDTETLLRHTARPKTKFTRKSDRNKGAILDSGLILHLSASCLTKRSRCTWPRMILVSDSCWTNCVPVMRHSIISWSTTWQDSSDENDAVGYHEGDDHQCIRIQ